MRTSNQQPANEKINSVFFIGNYLPRKCGIATFTTNLVESIASEATDCQPLVIAMNDRPQGYDYPERVRFEISQDYLETYDAAADFINRSQADVVCLQHEFGIFGGPDGEYILNLLQGVNLPVTTTLHTVLATPGKQQRSVMARLDQLTDRFIVMSQTAIHILNTVYDIPKEKIIHIPHGIPDIPFVDPNYYKDQFNLLERKVLLTFGFLSENKGIETVLKALPAVIDQFPDLIYIVLGATHPQVLKKEGETYREKLHQIVEDLGIRNHVEFKNRFVPQSELCDYLAAANIYITPYHNENQITSGTLAYAAGAGKAMISTPYWYAKEMLSEGRGCLVPFKDHNAMAETIIELFNNEAKRHKMRKCIYDFNRHATWEQVGRQYLDQFKKVKKEQLEHPKPHITSNKNRFKSNGTDADLPPLKLNHLLSLTDDTGLLQHACYRTARRIHGYCTDDNARALILTLRTRYFSRGIQTSPIIKQLEERYLAFLLHAFNPETGRFRNFMSYSREWLENTGSEDAHGRTLWALGNAVYFSQDDPYQSLSATLFLQALSETKSFRSVRAKAFTLLGAYSYLKEIPGDSQVRRQLLLLSEQLLKQFNNNASENWPWPENKLTYANGRLPHALILSGDMLQRDDIKQTGFQILEWLLNVQIVQGHLAPVGNQNWFKRGGEKSRFDQQPLEANALTEACLAAFEVSGNTQWIDYAKMCFQWFLGYNDLNLPLVDVGTGGCCDGLQCDQVNQNEGAESTLAWLLSLTAMHIFSEEDTTIDYSVIKN